MNYKQQAIEVAAQKATYLAAGGTVILGLTANELAALGGLLVAFLSMIIGAGISFYFKLQHLKIARARAEADGVDVDDEDGPPPQLERGKESRDVPVDRRGSGK